MTTKKPNNPRGPFWWKGMLALVSQTVTAEIHSVVSSARNQIQSFIRITTVRFFLLLASFLGLIFIIIGLSRLLGEVFPIPGVADILLGLTILSLSLLFFFFLKNNKED